MIRVHTVRTLISITTMNLHASAAFCSTNTHTCVVWQCIVASLFSISVYLFIHLFTHSLTTQQANFRLLFHTLILLNWQQACAHGTLPHALSRTLHLNWFIVVAATAAAAFFSLSTLLVYAFFGHCYLPHTYLATFIRYSGVFFRSFTDQFNMLIFFLAKNKKVIESIGWYATHNRICYNA